MSILRKAAALLLAAGLALTFAPAQARDTGWDCNCIGVHK